MKDNPEKVRTLNLIAKKKKTWITREDVSIEAKKVNECNKIIIIRLRKWKSKKKKENRIYLTIKEPSGYVLAYTTR